MQQADMDHTLFESGNNEGDKQLLVKFFNKARVDKEASLEAGRQVSKDVCYVSISVAGKRDPLAVRPATRADIQRFPLHHKAFSDRTEIPLEGTPLVEWALISRSQAEDLTFMNVKTVEQLSEMADHLAQQFMGGISLKQKAKHWLETASQGAEELKSKELLDKALVEKADLEAKLLAMSKRLDELEGVVDTTAKREPQTARPPRRSRAK